MRVVCPENDDIVQTKNRISEKFLHLKEWIEITSAMMATTASAGTPGVIFAPGDVNPGHIIEEPFNTNLIAPLST